MKYGVIKQRLYQMSKAGEVKAVSRGMYEARAHEEGHNLHNFHNQEDDKVTGVTEVTTPHNEDERLTAEEVQRVRQLTREGMKPELAREAVLYKRGRA